MRTLRGRIPHALTLVLLMVFFTGMLSLPERYGTQGFAAASSPPPLSLISTNLPAFTNDANAYDPAWAVDATYSTLWNTVDTPTTARPIWLALDLATVPAAHRQLVILAWFNDAGRYLPGTGNVFSNLPSNYTIDASSANGGSSSPPDSGWVTLVTVIANTTNQREHRLDLAGYNWVRIAVTGTKGSSGHDAAAFNLDVYDASAGALDSWLFLGDSITSAAMTHRGTAEGGAWTGGDYAQLVHAAAPGYYPLQINGGVGGWTSATGAANITALMTHFHGHFVSLAFGTNDANYGYPLSTAQIQAYYANMLTMIDAVQGTGAVAVVPYVPWGCKGYLGQNAWALNTYVNTHLPADRPGTVRGPDLWTAFLHHPSWMSPDCVHPSPRALSGQLSGLEQYQRVWEQWAVANIYRLSAPAPRPSPTSLDFPR